MASSASLEEVRKLDDFIVPKDGIGKVAACGGEGSGTPTSSRLFGVS